MAELFRLGISTEAKNKIIPAIDSKRFLRFDDEERATLYAFAVALSARVCAGARHKKTKYESFVMDKSLKNGPLANLLLAYFMTLKDVEKNIDKVGLSQRKDLVNDVLNPMADSGFVIMKEMMTKPEEVVIAKFISEMDEMYSSVAAAYKKEELPEPKTFEP